MKKLFTAAAVALALGITTANAGDSIIGVNGYAGGCEIRTTWGNYGIISSSDVGAAYICSAALTGLAGRPNGLEVTLYVASQVGWGSQTYGPVSIADVYLGYPQ